MLKTLCIILLCLTSLHSEELQLTPAEQAWLKTAPVLNVANEDDWPPYDFSIEGKEQGFSIDLLKLAAKKTGLKLNFINGHTWAELYEMGLQGKIDIFPCIWKTPERQKIFNYTDIYAESMLGLVIKANNKNIKSIKDLKHKKIAMVKDYGFIPEVRAMAPLASIIEYPSLLDCLKAVSLGTADATIDSLGAISYTSTSNKLIQLKIIEEYPGDVANALYMTTPKNATTLHSILMKGLEAVSPKEQIALQKRWFSVSNSTFQLSPLETALLETFPQLNIELKDLSKPYIVDQQKSEGLIFDTLNLIESKISKKFTPNQGGESTFMVSLSTQEFGSSLFKSPLIAIQKNEHKKSRHSRIALPKFFHLNKNTLEENWSKYSLHPYDSIEEAFIALNNDETDYIITDLTSFHYYQQHQQYSDLKIYAPVGTAYLNIYSPVEKLNLLLRKVRDAIPQENFSNIKKTWIQSQSDNGKAKTWKRSFYFLSLALLTIISLFLLWSRSLKQEISQRRQAQEKEEAARKKAEDATRAKDTFLATMSHEIRTPINGILSSAQLLKEANYLKTEEKELSEIIHSSCDSLLNILNDILDLAKLRSDKIEFEEIDFSIEETLKSLHRLFTGKAEEKGIKLKLSLPDGDELWLKGDPGRLRQILANLISNAIKFTEEGQVTTTLTMTPIDEYNQQISIDIEDQGIGISPEQQAQLFQEFSQADASISRKFGGTGLGLVISQQLARLMGGHIHVSSTVKKGSTFTVSLKLKKGHKQETVIYDQTPIKFTDTRILIVDDNRVNRLVLGKTLKKLNCIISEAKDGFEAVEACSKETFDLVFMDMQMPELDGISATKLIRKNDTTLPIVALTANASRLDKENCLKAGMNDFLAKPVRKELLIQTLQKFI